MKTKVLIINFNRITYPRQLSEWAAQNGCEPVFIDNASTNLSVFRFYESMPFRVIRMTRNMGHTVIWDNKGILDYLGVKDRFIITDPDLDLSGVPGDFLEVMNKGLDVYPEFSKCGLSLEIEDLPDTTEGKFIREREAGYWKNPLDDFYFKADTDTTFALYNYPLGDYSHSAIRCNRPYTAKHLPWYYTSFDGLPDDEKFYIKTATDSFSGLKRFKEYGW